MYREKAGGWLKHLDFIILDILSLELACMLAYLCRYGLQWPFHDVLYKRLSVLLVAVDICVIFFTESYHGILKRGYLVELRRILKNNFYILVLLMAYLFFTKQSALYSRAVFFLMAGYSCIIMLMVRNMWKLFLRERMNGRQKLFVIAEKETLQKTVESLKKQAYLECTLAGAAVIDEDMQGCMVCGVPVVAGRKDFIRYIKEHVVDQVFISVEDAEPELERWANQLVDMGLVIHINLVNFTRFMAHTKVEEFGGHMTLSTGMKSVTYGEMLLKRLMDICGALLGLLMTGIIFLVFAPIIYIQSPGKIFFTQDRVGRNGRIFKIYKFRSMYPDAEERKKELLSQNKMKGLMFKMEDDPRIIPIGRFMRKMSLDEFPQFLNVLKGDMSLVGTRPPTVEEYRQYEMEHKKRLAIKPGITGLWQTSGRSEIVDFDEVVALDAKYISEWSLWMDVKLLAKTVFVVMAGEGAV